MTSVPMASLFTPPAADHPLAKVPLTESLPKMHLFLYRNVKKGRRIRESIIKGTMPLSCIIDARMVLDIFQLQLACIRALLAQRQDTMKTRSLYSEILFNMSPSSNITESLKQFGVSDSTSSLILLFIGDEAPSDEDVDVADSLIQGNQASIFELAECCDTDLIKKLYKLSDAQQSRDISLKNVVNAMALKGFS
ncbi:hypothetical protein SmJEL517_g03532 [Synchytrium microbalum]|uniref:EKC/KEOPS complex subunit CGI121 n=1 Tax=Synchytrium microbalum TaxID=1806994 RepID=A0A507C7Y9_9FUNG|nr:uncharacterized protein SmJEL517_g03532 [Synchytrium microbalum]TPX33643.1 hypothetical protein SmJEL517_g03532 [Synchytrium microbalum]